mmetsp:Transcript_78778/g.209179  ORF Transcript_78778/g.209179 Transcript_78778/m.209179 type:complete len:232 (+) Transcript_78778:291-986(+)
MIASSTERTRASSSSATSWPSQSRTRSELSGCRTNETGLLSTRTALLVPPSLLVAGMRLRSFKKKPGILAGLQASRVSTRMPKTLPPGSILLRSSFTKPGVAVVKTQGPSRAPELRRALIHSIKLPRPGRKATSQPKVMWLGGVPTSTNTRKSARWRFRLRWTPSQDTLTRVSSRSSTSSSGGRGGVPCTTETPLLQTWPAAPRLRPSAHIAARRRAREGRLPREREGAGG